MGPSGKLLCLWNNKTIDTVHNQICWKSGQIEVISCYAPPPPVEYFDQKPCTNLCSTVTLLHQFCVQAIIIIIFRGVILTKYSLVFLIMLNRAFKYNNNGGRDHPSVNPDVNYLSLDSQFSGYWKRPIIQRSCVSIPVAGNQKKFFHINLL